MPFLNTENKSTILQVEYENLYDDLSNLNILMSYGIKIPEDELSVIAS